MSRFAPAVVLLLAAMATESGCHHDSALPAPSGSTSAAAAADGGETVVGIADDGKAFDLAAGSTLTVRLATHGGTGYVWAPAGLDGGDGGVLTSGGPRTSEVSSDTPGAPRVDVYRFVAGHPGTATVEMELRRPWGSEPAVKTWRVTVTVR